MWSRRRQAVVVLAILAIILYLSYLIPSDLRVRINEYTASQQWPYLSNSIQPPTPVKPNTTITNTTIAGWDHVPGFTTFNRLYVWNGTLYVVTPHPATIPELKSIISQPKNRENGVNIDPTPQDMQILSPEDAKTLFGERAIVLSGMSFIFWDTEQFMAHYYHWWGELILGAIRVYSSLALFPGMPSPLPEPSRFILPNIADHSWRDRAGVNGPLMRAAWPDASIERADLWNDLKGLNKTFVFERAMVISRTAAHTSPLSSLWYKMISSTMDISVPERFWKPIQRRVTENTVGYLPVMDNSGTVTSEPPSSAPVVTYISRQGGGPRRLSEEANQSLLDALNLLQEEGLCEVNVVAMEKLTFSQQIEAVARTTVIIGVHGNGLTHQLWMPSNPRSTIIEIFYPESYLHDYELLARNMGHKHYAVWNDTFVTYPPGQWFNGVEQGDRNNFHGVAIPVYGPTVASIIRERLTTRD